jgi:hypothetical protein
MIDTEAIRKRVRARLAEQRVLVRELLKQRAQLQGSLFVRYGVCGKESCVCRHGKKHGPYYVLSTGRAGGGFAYLDDKRLREARGLVERYREFRKGLRRLRKLNLDLVELLRRYQQTTAREGGRRLGLLGQKSLN